MKKFLIGIVSLAAAVMLTSSAFGALSEDGYYINDVGYFYFDAGLELTESIKIPHPPSDDNVLTTLEGKWGAIGTSSYSTFSGDITFIGKDEDVTGTEGKFDFFFDPAVQIVVAKWGGNPTNVDSLTSYAFLLNGYTEGFGWDLDDDYGMSHVSGYNAVPVPAAVWLLGSGVLGLVAIRRRRS